MTNHIKATTGDLPLMTMKAAAILALCSVKTIREEIKRKRLRAYRVGHKILIKPEDFADYISGREITHLWGDGSATPAAVANGVVEVSTKDQPVASILVPASKAVAPSHSLSLVEADNNG